VLLVPRLYAGLWERLVYKWEYDPAKPFLQVVETKSGVIFVGQDGTVYGGGAYDGVVNTRLDENDKNGILRAYVLGGFHPAPREVLMVGLASGSWAQVVANLPGVERMTIIEINPGYLEVIARHPEVRSLLANPKVSIVFDDGRRWMQAHDDRFDVVVMNTTLHWRGHATNILSTEFMEIARRHLRPSGIFYFNTTDSYDVQLTAARAFPHFMRVANFALVSEDPALHFDRPRWRTVLDTMTIDGVPILDRTIPRHAVIYDALLGYNDIEFAPTVVPRALAAGSRVVTDDNMVVEWRLPLRYPTKED
jgi:spermidine synthase